MSQRPLFDPHRVRPPGADTGSPAVLSVRQVNDLVRGALHAHVPATLHVLGEANDISRPGSGHLYFTLQDASSELRCVVWKSQAAGLRFRLEPGMEVIATGGLEVYTPRGSYQLIVRRLEPRGMGALELAFRQLRERLAAEGLFDAARKRPLPRFPRCVAIVTSPSGAAIRDIIHVLRRRFALPCVLLFPVRVQGPGAADEIARAIGQLNAFAEQLGGIDVAIIGRGGGSLEDLWAFNEEVVARAIAASRVPTISAVGHEIDVTISDLVADVRAPTPTAAAELLTPDRGALLQHIEKDAQRIRRAVRHAVALATVQLQRLLTCEGLARPLQRLRQQQQAVDEGQAAALAALRQHLDRARRRLIAAQLQVAACASGAAFRRSYAAVDDASRQAGRYAARAHSRARQRLQYTLLRLERVAPLRELSRQAEHVRHAAPRLAALLTARLQHLRRELNLRLAAVQACDPRRVLQRGYAITRDSRGRIVRSIREIRDKLRISVELADGTFRATADDPQQPRLFE